MKDYIAHAIGMLSILFTLSVWVFGAGASKDRLDGVATTTELSSHRITVLEAHASRLEALPHRVDVVETRVPDINKLQYQAEISIADRSELHADLRTTQKNVSDMALDVKLIAEWVRTQKEKHKDD